MTSKSSRTYSKNAAKVEASHMTKYRMLALLMPQHLVDGPELQQSLLAQLPARQQAAEVAAEVAADATTGAATAATTAVAKQLGFSVTPTHNRLLRLASYGLVERRRVRYLHEHCGMRTKCEWRAK